MPDLSTPAGTIRDLKGPWGVAVLERGKIVLAQLGNECISSIDSKGERKSFGTLGSESGQLSSPEGVTVDDDGKILVADHYNHRIQHFLSNGCHLISVGSNKGEFRAPSDIAIDSKGKVYVADLYITIIDSRSKANGVYLKEFGKKSELEEPVSITIDSHDVVCVGDGRNNRLSIIHTDGEFIKSIGNAA